LSWRVAPGFSHSTCASLCLVLVAVEQFESLIRGLHCEELSCAPNSSGGVSNISAPSLSTFTGSRQQQQHYQLQQQPRLPRGPVASLVAPRACHQPLGLPMHVLLYYLGYRCCGARQLTHPVRSTANLVEFMGVAPDGSRVTGAEWPPYSRTQRDALWLCCRVVCSLLSSTTVCMTDN
jgi:hypothetical protein